MRAGVMFADQTLHGTTDSFHEFHLKEIVESLGQPIVMRISNFGLVAS
jgi:hypothetical protein